jgi:hypothetical protein
MTYLYKVIFIIGSVQFSTSFFSSFSFSFRISEIIQFFEYCHLEYEFCSKIWLSACKFLHLVEILSHLKFVLELFYVSSMLPEVILWYTLQPCCIIWFLTFQSDLACVAFVLLIPFVVFNSWLWISTTNFVLLDCPDVAQIDAAVHKRKNSRGSKSPLIYCSCWCVFQCPMEILLLQSAVKKAHLI